MTKQEIDNLKVGDNILWYKENLPFERNEVKEIVESKELNDVFIVVFGDLDGLGFFTGKSLRENCYKLEKQPNKKPYTFELPKEGK